MVVSTCRRDRPRPIGRSLPPRAAAPLGRRPHHDSRRLSRRHPHRDPRRRAARPGAPGAVVRAARHTRGAGRRVLHATGRDPARRGPHPRRRARARAVRRPVAHRPRLPARRGRPPRGSRAATSSRAAPRGDLLQAGPLLLAGGEIAYDPDADAEGFRAAAHQFDPDPTDGRHPRAALGLADGRIVAVVCDGRSRPRRGPHAVRAGAADASRSAAATRSIWTAAGRPRWSQVGVSRTSRAATSRRRSRAGVRYRPLWSSDRARRRVCSRPGHRTFTRAASRHGARVLPARRVRARRAQPRQRARPRRLGRDDPVGLADAARRSGDAREFYAGLDVRPQDFTRALEARDPMRADPPMHPSYEDRDGAPDRVFASLDDEEYERQVPPGAARCSRVDAANADILHLHHLTPINAAARARRARRADRRPPARHRAADARGDRGRPAIAGRTRRRGPRACARGRARANGDRALADPGDARRGAAAHRRGPLRARAQRLRPRDVPSAITVDRTARLAPRARGRATRLGARRGRRARSATRTPTCRRSRTRRARRPCCSTSADSPRSSGCPC